MLLLSFLFLVYCIGFNLYRHRIAYFVLMVPLRIYSLTHSYQMHIPYSDAIV